jgi:tetratricopeptide (TPR) repeat protein
VLQTVPAIAEAPQRSFETADPGELRRRAFGALRELLARLGDHIPVVLWIDDLQWGDIDSARLLSDLLAPPDPPRLLVIACYRDEDVKSSPFLQMFLKAQLGGNGEKTRRDLLVEPLTRLEARSLAAALVGREAVSDENLDAIARESGGNPFFVGELVQGARSGASVRTDQITLDGLIQARTYLLPEVQRRLLEVVAVSGRPIEPTIACSAARLGAETAEAIHSLRSKRLARMAGGKIETYHDRIREAVVAGLSSQDVLAHHLQLAHCLEVEGTDPEFLAGHCEGAQEPEKAAHYYTQAADHASEALAFDRAAKLYRKALEMRRIEGAEGCRLRKKFAAALANAGRGNEAAAMYLAAADGADLKEALEMRNHAALHYLMSGHIDEGLAVAKDLLAAVGMSFPSTQRRALMTLIPLRLQLWLRGTRFSPRPAERIPMEELTRIDICWSIGIGLVFKDPIPAASFLTRCLLLALRGGEPRRIARGLAMDAGLLAAMTGRARGRAGRQLEIADSIAQKTEDPFLIGMVSFVNGFLAYVEGSWKKALIQVRQAEKIFHERCTGVAGELEIMHIIHMDSLFFLGSVGELKNLLPALIKRGEERGDLFSATTMGVNFEPFCHLMADDLQAAEEALSRHIDRWSHQSVHLQHVIALRSQIWIDLYAGRGTAAWLRITQQWPVLERSLILRTAYFRISMRHLHGCSALAAATEADNAAPFLRAAGQDARRLEGEGLSWATALARLLRAGIAFLRGDPGSSESFLAVSLDQLETLEMKLWAAAARRRIGELVGRERGLAMIRKADSAMTAQTVRNAARMADLLVPGFKCERSQCGD